MKIQTQAKYTFDFSEWEFILMLNAIEHEANLKHKESFHNSADKLEEMHSRLVNHYLSNFKK